MTNQEALVLDSVSISRERVAEMDEGRPIVSVHGSDVQSITLRFAQGAERPLLVATIGMALVVLGTAPLVLLGAILLFGGEMRIFLIYLCGFLIPGLWMLRLASKKRLHLVVKTNRGKRKLLFKGTLDRSSVEEFLEEAASRFGYITQIDSNVPGGP